MNTPHDGDLVSEWIPPSILPVKGMCCGEGTVVTGSTSFSPSSSALAWAGLGMGQQARGHVQA